MKATLSCRSTFTRLDQSRVNQTNSSLGNRLDSQACSFRWSRGEQAFLIAKEATLIPTEEEVCRLERFAVAAQSLADACGELTALNESLEDFRDIVKELARLKLPTSSQMQAIATHLENLQAVEELAEV